LAAQAAVLKIDGISRRPLGGKLCGVFNSRRLGDHQLTTGFPVHLQIPHSRWNEIPEDILASHDYQVLTRSDHAGADIFVKNEKGLPIFMQGHPEYEAESLLLEYQRDVRRFLRGERTTYPSMPEGYFTDEAVAALRSFEERALSDPGKDILRDFPRSLAESVSNTWWPYAVQLYRNWLLYLSERKASPRKAMAFFA
jgi:homoserine O-succinyltransferase